MFEDLIFCRLFGSDIATRFLGRKGVALSLVLSFFVPFGWGLARSLCLYISNNIPIRSGCQ